ncbi:hypothetical protein [Planctomycetes bacterium K23_9]|uniref:Leucine Rich repeats (2 copies) n=1 Tax=Stieleria marina TaxID=1930275 RepID=A0A517NRC6_9BACT|nr:Leucine Rich repeats (2 copies) [Planctomycetes bacterium K23_9]
MELVFEYCFYVGVLLILCGGIWLLRSMMKRSGRSIASAVGMVLLGVALIVGPAVISRMIEVDLGPREVIVQGERHLSLTGWDGDDYRWLANKPDTVILQMGNADVTDETLQWLTPMSQLRELDLNDSAITDSGLARLAKMPSLKSLRIRGTKITDQGFRQHLMTLENLRNVDVRQTAVSEATMDEWKTQQPGRRAFQ